MTLSITTFIINDAKHYDTQKNGLYLHNNTQHKDTQHKGRLASITLIINDPNYDTQNNVPNWVTQLNKTQQKETLYSS